ncbi:heterocyst differentiation protein HetZ [Phormidium yuhuli AB48]|uniref:Heterocyst differentiation protein HetZ n=1 Tax=Phormidium yuhuli AB48 TaxID=2940671 RepID=A0ABY5AR26_9CYAN|nr:heterocyst differentiation protein HetZ [Phormidium yuhuli]USR91678.1 heterocyst differentiation protein HetZ [Phormidium yuhuli AB48]
MTDSLVQWLAQQLQTNTRASPKHCQTVASRIAEEVTRTCEQSQRIQRSGDVLGWGYHLAQHRLEQILQYYRRGSEGGRLELHSTLSAIVYRYVNPPNVQSSYGARLQLIEDFLQTFYLETLNALRREAQLPPTHSPRSLLELAEYLAFTERYGKRRIHLNRGRSQQLIILRAQTFAQQQPLDLSVDLQQASDGKPNEGGSSSGDASLSQVRDRIVDRAQDPTDDLLRRRIIEELITYLDENNQSACADYFVLRLQDLPTSDIEAILGLNPRERDYLQQRFKYHLIRFSLSHRWQLVHEWLDADLDHNLGMTSAQWESFLRECNAPERDLLDAKRRGDSDEQIIQQLGLSPAQLQRRWFSLLKRAWDYRND